MSACKYNLNLSPEFPPENVVIFPRYSSIRLLQQELALSFPRPVLIRPSKWAGLEGLDERTAGSLIPETLQGMEEDVEFKLTGIYCPDRLRTDVPYIVYGPCIHENKARTPFPQTAVLIQINYMLLCDFFCNPPVCV